MKNRELILMQLKLRAAVDYILKTPEVLPDRSAVERLRDALPVPVHPMRTDLNALTVLRNESE